MTHLLPVYARSNYTFERGEGVYLYDKQGKKYLDFIAGIGVNSMGHCHPHVTKALQEQAGKLWHVSNLYHIEGAEYLAERITKASGFAYYAFFCNSGAEAVECGIKMVRKYHYENGNKGKYRIITFDGAFHGRTLATISAAKKDKLTKGFFPLVDGFDTAEFGNLESVKKAITPETGGILIEPVQGEGGIRLCSAEFLQGLRKICDENGLLLFFDGVQCGMGRTGKFFSHEWAGVHPDITSSAKGIGTGFPLAACLCTKAVGDAMHAGSHGSTYAGNPLSIAVGNAVMDIMLADGFFENVCKVGDFMMEEFKKMQAKYSGLIKEVRGKGLMIGVQLNQEKAGECKDFVDGLRLKGLLTATAGENVVRMLPPLILTKAQAEEGLKIFEAQLQEIA
jgi:acetylornithine/N-succinyldiaminopimelate aminotransferase